ncbi:MAG: tetratricopeptide repeat protein [Bacteroidetes bacterium]|nr:tetratricopeptide repeat protein [Bacteroidota bacterium]
MIDPRALHFLRSLTTLPSVRAASLLMTGLMVMLPLWAPASWAQPADRSAVQRYQDGLHQFNNGLFAASASTFLAFRSTYPDHPRAPDAMFHEAESYLALDREDDAIRLLRAFEERYPSHPYAFGSRLALGKYFFEQDDYARAILTLEQVLEGSPTPEQASIALYWMGESAYQLQRPDEAIGYLERIVREYPQSEVAPRAAYAIAFNQVQLGRYDQAAASFERLNRQFASSAFAANMGLALAEVYYEIDDYRRAAEEIERRLPNLSGAARERAIFLLAESQNQNRNHDQAIVNYRHFTEGNPESEYFERALYGLAWNYHHEGAWQWAADNFQRVVDADYEPLAGESAYYAGVNLRLAENMSGAVGAFRSFLDRWPDHRLADHGWMELGITLYQLRQWDQARDAFRTIVRRFPDSDLRGEALNLGNTEVALGNFDGAHEAFDEAIAMGTVDPSLGAAIIFQKAWLNYRNRIYDEAARDFLALFQSDPAGERAADAMFWAAESFFQDGDLAQAGTLFRRYLREQPSGQHRDAAQYALGWTYFRQADYASAIPHFEAFLDSFRDDAGTVPYRTDARLRLADSYFALKRYPEAVRVYGRLSAEGDDYALYQIGQAYSNSGDAFEAMTTFRNLLEEYPGSEWREEARYSLGYLFFLNQEYDQAILEYDALIGSYPLDPLAAKAQYGKGDAWFNAGDINAAVRAYQGVLSNYPKSPFVADAAAGIQFALMAAGQEERADAIVDSLAQALAGTPAADQLRFRQAEAKYQAGLLDAALADFMRFVQVATDPELVAQAWYYIGEIQAGKGADAAAADAFRTVVENHPQSERRAEAAGALGHLMLDASNAAEAERLFRIMERSASDPRTRSLAYYGLSLALRMQGRNAEAEELLREATANTPPSDATYPAYLGMARITQDQGDVVEAERLYDMVASRSRDETGAEALYLLGRLQMDQGRLNQGIETMSRMQALFAGYPRWLARSLIAQASAFEDQDNPGQAIRLYQTILSMYPESEEAPQARTRLEVLTR